MRKSYRSIIEPVENEKAEETIDQDWHDGLSKYWVSKLFCLSSLLLIIFSRVGVKQTTKPQRKKLNRFSRVPLTDRTNSQAEEHTNERVEESAS